MQRVKVQSQVQRLSVVLEVQVLLREECECKKIFEAGSVQKTKLQVSPDLWKLLGTITAYLYIIFMYIYLKEL